MFLWFKETLFEVNLQKRKKYLYPLSQIQFKTYINKNPTTRIKNYKLQDILRKRIWLNQRKLFVWKTFFDYKK